MILVSERRAEQRHDPISHHLVYGALVTVDRFHQMFEYWVKELSRLFRIAVGEQLHRSLEVGEKDCHLLALTLEGALRSQDLIGEVLRRVDFRRPDAQ